MSITEELTIKPIARIYNDFTEKFGVPRQSGLAQEVISTIIFEPEYREAEAFRGLSTFSHIWLIWGFSKTARKWTPTVRPPRLGGNRRMGVFATRSPFRPNPLGLSAVELCSAEQREGLGMVLTVAGADLMNMTPIYDIKPYLPYADMKSGASGGYTEELDAKTLEVRILPELLERLPEEKKAGLLSVLRNDPRPAYQDNPDRVYKMAFAGFDVSFKVADRLLIVTDITDN